MPQTANHEEATSASPWIKETTTAHFMQDVIAESQKQPVLVDFWAPWCGPCQQLAPVLEKVIKEAKGKVKLVKLNIDEHQAIPGQLGIRSIPAVLAFNKGQMLDGFMGALPESQIRTFIESLVGKLGPDENTQLLEKGHTALKAGDAAGAASDFAALLAKEPHHRKALNGLIQAHILGENLQSAQALFENLTEADQLHPDMAQARAALDLAAQKAQAGPLKDLETALAKNDNDHQARLDLSTALAAMGKKREAVDHLLILINKDRRFGDDAARKQLVSLFDLWGPNDPETLAGRRRLSSILFA